MIAGYGSICLQAAGGPSYCKGGIVQITNVALRAVAMNKVCAIASIVIDDAFVVHDLRIVNGDKGLFVAMPSRKLPNGDFRDVCHPINSEARTEIQRVVLEHFEADGGVAAFATAAAELPGAHE